MNNLFLTLWGLREKGRRLESVLNTAALDQDRENLSNCTELVEIRQKALFESPRSFFASGSRPRSESQLYVSIKRPTYCRNFSFPKKLHRPYRGLFSIQRNAFLRILNKSSQSRSHRGIFLMHEKLTQALPMQRNMLQAHKHSFAGAHSWLGHIHEISFQPGTFSGV